MRIVLATPIYPPEVGGPATYTIEIAERLRGTHEIVVVAYTNAEADAAIELVAVSKKDGLLARLKNYFFAVLREARKSDIIYVQNAVAAGLPAVLAGKLARKPVILKFVGDEAWERATQAGKTTKQLEDFYKSPEGGLRTYLYMAIQRFVLRRVTIVTTPSAYLSELLITYYGVQRERAVVNYNATEVPHLGSVVRKPHQLVTGVRLAVWKNVAGIIHAVQMLVEKFPDITLIVAGDGPEKESLKELVKQKDLGQHVFFQGRVSKELMREFQAESGVQILNSWYEGMPHGVLESFAANTPIIATNIPGTNEAVYNEETGLLVPVGNDRALAEAIERLFKDQNLYEKVVAGGAKILQEKFSWTAHIQKLEEMFKAVHPTNV